MCVCKRTCGSVRVVFSTQCLSIPFFSLVFSLSHIPAPPRPFGLPHPHLNTDHFIPRSLGTDGAWSECRPAWEIKKGSPSSVCIDHSSRWDNWDNTRPVYMTCKLLLSQFSFLSSFSNCPFNRPHCVLLIDFPTYLNCVLVKLFCLFHLIFLIYLKSSMCDILRYVWLLEKKKTLPLICFSIFARWSLFLCVKRLFVLVYFSSHITEVQIQGD